MSKKLIVAVIAAVMTVSIPSHSSALSVGQDSPVGDVLNKVDKTVDSTVKVTENTVKAVSDTAKSVAPERRDMTPKERVEERRAELRAEREKKLSERKERLEGRRLAQCQNRQDKINFLIDKTASSGQEKFDRIKNYKDAISQFYANQNLYNEQYEAAINEATAKEALASATLAEITTIDYDCTAVDATNPAEPIRTTNEAKRMALIEYRDSVKTLLSVVRESTPQQQQGTTDATE